MHNEQEIGSSLILTYTFDIDIEKVYLGLFTGPFLEKIGLIDFPKEPNQKMRYISINSLSMNLMKNK